MLFKKDINEAKVNTNLMKKCAESLRRLFDCQDAIEFDAPKASKIMIKPCKKKQMCDAIEVVEQDGKFEHRFWGLKNGFTN